MLISTSVIWFCGRRQKPCCCALHFINHCFMWTRSDTPPPPQAHHHLPPSLLPLVAGPGPPSRPSSSAMFTRPSGGSQDQTSSLLITLDYFHLPGVSQAFRQRGRKRKRERDDFLTNSAACGGTSPRAAACSVLSVLHVCSCSDSSTRALRRDFHVLFQSYPKRLLFVLSTGGSLLAV